jgi:hypothetical protein
MAGHALESFAGSDGSRGDQSLASATSTVPPVAGTMVTVNLSPAVGEGAWIFLSHSHRDLHEVRRVRDALEAKGHQPLLFFLKCLDDDAEIDDLIGREIEARQFFLLCDSPNARASRWVQQEVSLIKTLDGKVSLNLDLKADWQAQLAAIEELSRRATVFISYQWQNGPSRELAVKVTNALRRNDYRVFLDIESINVHENMADQLIDAITAALQNGYVLLLLSPEMFTSDIAMNQALLALAMRDASGRHSSVIPIIGSEQELTLSLLASSPLSARLGYMPTLDFTAGEFTDNMAELLRVLTK